jgi:phosphoserine phosphatase
VSNRPVYLFDLDGTLTREELLPRIAVAAGLPSIAELTRRTMAGDIPFQESFRHRVELLSTVSVELIADVVESVPVHEQVMAWIHEHRDDVWVVTGNVDRWVEPWLTKWGLRGFSSRTEIVGGRVRLVAGGILEKDTVLREFADRYVVMVGDGANDAEIVRRADFGIASQLLHAAPEVLLESADCIVNSEEALCRVLSRL